MASSQAIQTFGRTFADPGQSFSQSGNISTNRIDQINLLWAYYSGSMFDKGASQINAWLAYKQRYGLYRNIRTIYNPTTRLVDFYAGTIYRGVLSEDGSKLPEGVDLAIPLSADTNPKLKAAIAQFWQWSNWQANKSVHIRFAAACGFVLIKVVDDYARGKVCADVVWPGNVSEVELDPAGNVKKYVIEYKAQEPMPGTGLPGINNPTTRFYKYREEVDTDSFRYYKDGKPFKYESYDGAVVPNPYGFVPAVWIPFIPMGGLDCAPAIHGSMGKIDELNNLASMVNDRLAVKMKSPWVFWGGVEFAGLTKSNTKRGATNDFNSEQNDQEMATWLKGPAGGKAENLDSSLDLSDTAQDIDRLIGEIEADHPELGFYKEMRAMSTLTGPAASRVVGDVTNRVQEIAAGFDQANIKLFQMAVAIGGFRCKQRLDGWDNQTSQQKKFRFFDLDSYPKGLLDFAIDPRPLVMPTETEVSQEKLAFYSAVAAGVGAGIPLEVVLEDMGWDAEKIRVLQTLVAAKQAQEQDQLQAQQANQLAIVQAQAQGQVQAQNQQPPRLPPGRVQ